MFGRPKPRRERLRLELLTLEPKFQLRDLGGQTFDEEYVEHLLELHEMETEFLPLHVVEQTPVTKGREPKRWLIDGFNRAEMYRRANVGLVDCLIFPGTVKDAELWVLASNGDHGKARTPAECRAAFDKLLASPMMVERVVAERGKYHGTERALAKACGLSHGIVGKYLREHGLRVDRLSGRLVPADGPDSPEREARRELVAECEAKGLNVTETAEELGVCTETVKKDREAMAAKKATSRPRGQEVKPAPAPEPAAAAVAAAPALAPKPTPSHPPARTAPAPALPAAPKPTPAPEPSSGRDAVLDAAEDTVAEMYKHLRAVARGVDSLIASKVGAQLRTKAKLAGVPFDVREVDVELAIPRPGDPMKKLVTTWPALVGLMETFSQLSAELALASFAPEK